MTLAELQADLYRRFGYATPPGDTTVTTRFTAFLNETQREIVSSPGMERLLTGTGTVASVASTPTYALPPSVSRILKIYDATNRYALQSFDRDFYRQVQPDTSTPTGLPSHYVDLGLACVVRQPATASALYVVSTSASDTGTAYLEGFRAGGYPFSASVVMTGTTAVSVGLSDILEVTKFYLSAAAVGSVTLTDTI